MQNMPIHRLMHILHIVYWHILHINCIFFAYFCCILSIFFASYNLHICYVEVYVMAVFDAYFLHIKCIFHA